MAPADQETEAEEATLLVRSGHFLSVTCLVIALVAYLFNVWVSRLVPPLSADSLIYHLTIPAEWTQRGFLHPLDLPFHDGAAEHSPLFTETIHFGLMKLTGSDNLAWLVQPAFFLLMVALFHRSLRLLGLPPATARFLTAIVLLFPPFFHSSLIVNSEMVMTCGVAAFCYGMLVTGTRRQAGCCIAAAGIALTTASKTVGVIYGSLAVLVLAGWFVAAARGGKDAAQPFRWRRSGAICLVIVLGGLAFHFWNLARYGNPLYPAELSIAGIPILPGRYNAAVFINHGWSPAAFSKMLLYDTESHAMNRQFGIVLWLAMLVPPTLLILRRLTTADRLPGVLLIIYPLASIVMYFAVVPFWSEHRLLFPVYYLLWLNLGWSIRLILRETGELAGGLTAAGVGLACVVYALFFLFFDEVPFWLLGCGGALGIVLANYPRLMDLVGRRQWAISAVVVVLFAGGSPWWYPQLNAQRAQASQSAYSQMYGPQGEAWSRLTELTADRPATIAYSGNALIFPLFGPQLANRVVYLPIHPHDQPVPIQLEGKDSIYLQLARQRRSERDEEYWLEQLKKQRVNYLLLVNDPKFGGVDAERTFASRNPGLLRLVYEQDGVWIYAVK